MTREEAIKQMEVVVDEMLEQEGLNVINEIYNDFESRTCGNCKYHNEGFVCDEVHAYTAKDFGCNRFKRKQDD